MTQEITTTVVAERECFISRSPEAKALIIQPIDEREAEMLSREVSFIRELSTTPFTLVAFKISDWNSELTPWPAPPVFGKQPFGDGAEATLSFITDELLPHLRAGELQPMPAMLAGYSLAGLFALWASYRSDSFAGIAAASPSVWYPRWLDFSSERATLARAVYLSLGDKEAKSRNPLMSKVDTAITAQHELLLRQGVATALQWNMGNHFVDADKRLAKAIAWLLNLIS